MLSGGAVVSLTRATAVTSSSAAMVANPSRLWPTTSAVTASLSGKWRPGALFDEVGTDAASMNDIALYARGRFGPARDRSSGAHGRLPAQRSGPTAL